MAEQIEHKRGLYFNYKTRCIINVSSAVADQIINNYCFGEEIGEKDTYYSERSVLLSIRGKVPVCSFEGGTTVRVNLVDRCLYDESLREKGKTNWVVTHCNVRFYERFANNIPKPQKSYQVWDAKMLRQLWEVRKWNYPEIMSLNALKEQYPEFENDYNPYDYHPDEYWIDEDPLEAHSADDYPDSEDDLHRDNPVEVETESNWSLGQRYH